MEIFLIFTMEGGGDRKTDEDENRNGKAKITVFKNNCAIKNKTLAGLNRNEYERKGENIEKYMIAASQKAEAEKCTTAGSYNQN